MYLTLSFLLQTIIKYGVTASIWNAFEKKIAKDFTGKINRRQAIEFPRPFFLFQARLSLRVKNQVRQVVIQLKLNGLINIRYQDDTYFVLLLAKNGATIESENQWFTLYCKYRAVAINLQLVKPFLVSSNQTGLNVNKCATKPCFLLPECCYNFFNLNLDKQRKCVYTYQDA